MRLGEGFRAGVALERLGEGRVAAGELLAPLLARSICGYLIDFESTLINLTVDMLLKVAAIFAMLSATIHQLWFTFRGYSDNFISNTAVMALGDFVGTILVLYAAKFLAERFAVVKDD